MIEKLWKDNRRELTEGEKFVRAELVEQGGDDAAEALNYAAVTLHAARIEQERLWQIIKDQRIVIQRLQFPNIYPHNSPIGEEETARQIYAVAAHIVELMKREGMEQNYDVTFNCMSEVASYGVPLVAAHQE